MTVRSLFPSGDETLPLKALYLGLNMHRLADEGELLIYSNFVASIDGRISRLNPETGDYEVPASLANPRDWRLYQELAAQSDILITSARYFRQLARGTAQDVLPVGSGFDDLKQWREARGLKEQPDVAIVSRSLDIPAGALEQLAGREIYIFTAGSVDAGKRRVLESSGVTIVSAGEREVEGDRLREELIRLGFRSACMIAGPGVHGTLLKAGALDRLFLTTRFTLLGSEKTHGLVEGGDEGVGEGAGTSDAELASLYLDEVGQQLFAQYRFARQGLEGR